MKTSKIGMEPGKIREFLKINKKKVKKKNINSPQHWLNATFRNRTSKEGTFEVRESRGGKILQCKALAMTKCCRSKAMEKGKEFPRAGRREWYISFCCRYGSLYGGMGEDVMEICMHRVVIDHTTNLISLWYHDKSPGGGFSKRENSRLSDPTGLELLLFVRRAPDAGAFGL